MGVKTYTYTHPHRNTNKNTHTRTHKHKRTQTPTVNPSTVAATTDIVGLVTGNGESDMTVVLIVPLLLLIICGVVGCLWLRSRKRLKGRDQVAKRAKEGDDAIAPLELMETGTETGTSKTEKAKVGKEASRSEASKSVTIDASKSEASKNSEEGSDESEQDGSGEEDGV